ncbi:transcriptional regulator [Vibrio splendidus]|uniref:transcriptional regulator n=1 Tax=Vibrio splendidus TaxID=29497 RepID=UPI000C858706|nr:transcriptional regulator [Vibrio splendidus]PMP51664.1 hypothetical protein BCS83_02375 [Vibrio splendidus]
MENTEIRSETLTAFGPEWLQPTGDEVRAMLFKCDLTGSEAAALVGVSDSRTVRKWAAYDPAEVEKAKQEGRKTNMQRIPYAAWAILAECAGLGLIWKK